MRYAQLLDGQRRRQPAGVQDFQAIREEHDLNAAAVRVVTVRHCVHDRLGHHLLRDLVLDGRLHALCSGAHRQRNLAMTKTTAWSTSANTVPL